MIPQTSPLTSHQVDCIVSALVQVQTELNGKLLQDSQKQGNAKLEFSAGETFSTRELILPFRSTDPLIPRYVLLSLYLKKKLIQALSRS